MIARPEHALGDESRGKGVSAHQPVDTNGAGVCPGGMKSSVMEPERGVRAHAEVVPCGANAVLAKRQAQALQAEAVRTALFVKAKMSDTPVGCPRLEPRIWRAKIA